MIQIYAASNISHVFQPIIGVFIKVDKQALRFDCPNIYCAFMNLLNFSHMKLSSFDSMGLKKLLIKPHGIRHSFTIISLEKYSWNNVEASRILLLSLQTLVPKLWPRNGVVQPIVFTISYKVSNPLILLTIILFVTLIH